MRYSLSFLSQRVRVTYICNETETEREVCRGVKIIRHSVFIVLRFNE
jgi:hypothetical protein